MILIKIVTSTVAIVSSLCPRSFNFLSSSIFSSDNGGSDLPQKDQREQKRRERESTRVNKCGEKECEGMKEKENYVDSSHVLESTYFSMGK